MELIGILFKLPMPPTANKQLMPVRGRLIKTNAARVFDKQIAFYRLSQFRKLETLKLQMSALLQKEKCLFSVHYYFCFPKDRLISKKNEIKMLDSTNRLKSTEDALSKLIEIDDKYFNQNRVEKVISSTEKEFVHIAIYKINHLEDDQKVFNIAP